MCLAYSRFSENIVFLSSSSCINSSSLFLSTYYCAKLFVYIVLLNCEPQRDRYYYSCYYKEYVVESGFEPKLG